MRFHQFQSGVSWLAMVGLVMISGLRAQADDDGNSATADQLTQTEVRETKVRIIDGEHTEDQVIRVQGEPSSQQLVQQDVLITTDDGQKRVERMLRIDAAPAGDVLAVRLFDDAQKLPEELDKYWIGVRLNEVSRALRSQLNLEDGRGVLVGEVLPDSPASKAGVKQFDIVLAIGDDKVGRNEDVLKYLKAADGKEVRLVLLRGGSERSVTVTPVERPKREVVAGAPNDAGAVATWIQKLNPSQQWNPTGGVALWPDVQFDVVKPGQVLALQEWPAMRAEPLPEDLTITVTREGKSPARIKVKQKEREIETTEDNLREIPEDLRRYVEPMIGRNRGAISFRGSAMALPQPGAQQRRAVLRLDSKAKPAGDVLVPAQPGQEGPQKRVRALPPGGVPAGVERRIEDLERRLDELQRSVRGSDESKDDAN